ncbi:MAG: hypothetical protein FWE18_04415 [Alphaproteobacteria bacterium]|nr:hypothetical protein [Alphaproteobacteria bacterium]
MFNLISTGELPALKPYTTQLEIMPNGKSRQTASVSTNLDLAITVSRDSAKANLDILLGEFEINTVSSLRIIDKTSGEVIGDWQKAVLKDIPSAGAITESANDVVITFSCINEM